MAITFGTVDGNANDGTKWVGGVAPGAGDDVLFIATSANCTITASVTWNSLNCTGYTGVLTHNASVTLTLDSQDALGNSLILVSGMTYTLGSATNSAITFTGAGTSKITTGTKILGNVVFNNSGDTFQLQDGLTTSGNFTLTAGTFDANSQTVTLIGATPQIVAAPGSITFYNLVRTGNAVATDTLVFAANTTTITNSLTLTGNSSINRLLVTSNSLGTARTITLGASATTAITNTDFRDIAISHTARVIPSCASNGGDGDVRFATSVVHELVVGDSVTIAGMGIAGYNGVQTVTAVSDTTHFEINVAYSADADEVGTFTKAALNLATVAGGSGNCGGNTGITFTTADNWYFYQTTNSGTHNFSDYTQWYEVSGGTTQMASTRCVLPQDNAFGDASSINGTGTVTIDQDMPRMCKTLDFTGVDAVAFHMNNANQTFYGGLTFVNNVAVTAGNTVTFESMDRAGSYAVTSAGKTFSSYDTNFNMLGGTLTLSDNAIFGTNGGNGRRTNHNNGILIVQGDFYSACPFTSASGLTRSLYMGSGTWTCGNAYSYSDGFQMTSTNLTVFDAETSTLVLGGNSYAGTGYGLGATGFTFYNLTIGDSEGNTINGANTYNVFTIPAGKRCNFKAGSNNTVASFVATGDAANHIVIASVTAGSNFQLTKSGGGTCINDYLDVTDSHGHPDSTFYFGANGSGDAYSLANGWGSVAGSPSASPSASESASPSTSPSASPSASISASPSASISASPSASPSASVSGSPSASPSASVSSSPSASISASPSASISASPSASISASPSASVSASPSASISASPSSSISASPSSSPSASVSASPSASISASPSASISASPSASPSASISGSPSASPSGAAGDEDTYYICNTAADGSDTLDMYVDGILVERNTSV
jgi:hypothetical protein